MVYSYRLVHDAHHDITENTELKEVSKLDTQIERLLDVGLSQVEDQSDSSKHKVISWMPYLKPWAKKVGK